MRPPPIVAFAVLAGAVACLAVTTRPSSAGDAAAARIITPNEFQGSDVERINRAVEAAALAGGRVVIPRVNLRGDERREVWLLDSAILLRSGTTLELDNCRLKLSDRCRDNFMRSANCGMGIRDIQPMHDIHIRGIGSVVLEGADHPRATGDSGKTIGTRTYGSDAGIAGESQSGDWRNIGILMAYVERFSIQNLLMKDSHCWAMSLERCAQGTLRDLAFESSGFRMIDRARKTILNQDGIDLRMGCHDILVEDISGYTGDDLVALTAIPGKERLAGGTGSTMVSDCRDRGQGQDDIHHVIVRNVRGYCRGGHHIVRLLNTSGVRMYDILVDGLIDGSPPGFRCRAAVKIGDTGYGGGIAPLGDTRGIIVNNVISRATHTILIGGSLCDSILSNIIRHGADGEAVTMAAGAQHVRDVTISNVRILKE
jgi:hypothetical protein